MADAIRTQKHDPAVVKRSALLRQVTGASVFGVPPRKINRGLELYASFPIRALPSSLKCRVVVTRVCSPSTLGKLGAAGARRKQAADRRLRAGGRRKGGVRDDTRGAPPAPCRSGGPLLP